jgi:hypothetical protein
VKKPQVVTICDELVEDGDLQVKDFKKVRIYMAKQNDEDATTPAELDELAQRETQLKERLAEQKAKNSKIDGQIRQLNNEPSDAELAKQLKEYAKTIETLNTKLARFKTDKNPVTKVSAARLLCCAFDCCCGCLILISTPLCRSLVPQEGMNKAQLRFNEMCKQWRIRKRAVDDIIDQMCGDEGDPKQIKVRRGENTCEVAWSTSVLRDRCI